MARGKTKDMTVGSPMRHIIEFSVPLLLGFLFQQLYNIFDAMIVGRFVGLDALAAVGSTGSVNFLIIGFCMGVCNGFSIPLAQRFGARDNDGMKKYMMNAIYLSVFFAVILTVVTVVFCKQILVAMDTPGDILALSYNYIVIILAGIPVTFLYNLISGIIRAMGDSKTPVYFLVMSSVINIVLDLVLINVFSMGVVGAAVATVVSQLVSGVCCVIYSYKRYELLHVEKRFRKIDGRSMGKLLYVGIPMGLQYSITAIGSVVLQKSVNSLGKVAVASMTAGGKVSMFFCCPYDAMGSTMATYGGQNVGAGKIDRLNKGLFSVSVLGVAYSIIALVFLAVAWKPLVSLFIGEGESMDVYSNAHMVILYNALFYIPLAFVNIVRFLIQGMGYSQIAIIAGICEMAARTFVGFMLVPQLGFKAACIASPVAWVMADMFLFPAYFIIIKKMKRIAAR